MPPRVPCRNDEVRLDALRPANDGLITGVIPLGADGDLDAMHAQSIGDRFEVAQCLLPQILFERVEPLLTHRNGVGIERRGQRMK